MHDSFGDRIKKNYEDRTRYYLPRRTNTIIRLDGKAFHTYTRGLQRPFDRQFMNDMYSTMLKLCNEIQGAKIGYTQSDEISILLTDYDTIDTEAWFDGNLQKMCSVSASIATEHLNRVRPGKPAYFDARVFTIPDLTEVANYFLWRTQDAERNSLQALAQSLYSQKELHGKATSALHDMCFAKGHNWNNLTSDEKHGPTVVKVVGRGFTQCVLSYNKITFEDWFHVVSQVTKRSENGLQ